MFKRKYRLPLFTLVVLAYLAGLATGCNAVKGLGYDIANVAGASEDIINGRPITNNDYASADRR